MQIICNGQQRELEEETSLAAMLAMLELDPNTVVAEVNKKIIERDQYEDLRLRDGDRVELIRFVGGG
ncbi:MAG TPA: sulfur carrier protein ThiS [Desulfobulbus sp.]|nr:sulfur carrier protein ThiS [Desulfobulbus sp.]